MEEKFNIQDAQYSFPYHYLPHTDGENATIYRYLYWGFAYLARTWKIITSIEQHQPKSILDLGCGDGAILKSLSANPQYEGVKLVGIDLSERAIGLAKAMNPTLDFRVQDISTITERFDCIVCNQVLEHIPDEAVTTFISSAVKTLNPDGIFIITVPSKLRPVEKKHYRHYDIGLLQQEIGQATSELCLESYSYILNQSGWYRAYLKLTCNRAYFLRIPLLDRLFWKTCKRNVDTIEGKGTSLFACYVKRSPCSEG